MFVLGYNTNGFAHHQFEDACAILAEIGYRSVALTVERSLLASIDGHSVDCAAKKILPILTRHRLRCTIETGSRYYLDPRRKHQPTLISADPSQRRQRIDFLNTCIDLAAAVNADSVSLWSGAAEDSADENVLSERLLSGLREVLDHARTRRVRLSFEPEPGMAIDSMEKFAGLQDELRDPLLGLTLDVGHVHCLRDGEAPGHMRKWRAKLWNVHIEDMRRGAHEHLMFGEGDMDFAPMFSALREISYSGPLHVELSRHSHNAVEVAQNSFAFMSKI